MRLGGRKLLRKIVSVMVLVMLLLGMSILVLEMRYALPATSTGRTIRVPFDFATIQEAINNASDGDTIEVVPKETPYYENVTVNKMLTIRRWPEATPGDYPVVDGENREGVVFNVTVDGVEINGFIIRNGQYGILLTSSNNHLRNVTLTSNGYGIYIGRESANNTLRENKIIGNTWNFGVAPFAALYNMSIPLDHFIQDIDETNTVDDKPVYYWVNHENESVPADAGYVAIVNSTDIIVENLSSLRSNYQGVLIAYSSEIIVKNFELSDLYTNLQYGIVFANVSDSAIQNVTISDIDNSIWLECSENNRVQNNRMWSTRLGGITGVWLEKSNNNVVADNLLRNDYFVQAGFGIILQRSNNNSVTGNSISRNVNGLSLSWSNNSLITHNNFLDNLQQVDIRESVDNKFDNGYEGNFWSDYSGIDSNGDGIGETSYVINSGNRDNCPLIEEWKATRIINVTWYALKPHLITIASDHVVASYRFKPNSTEKTGFITFNITSNTLGFYSITISRDRLDSPFELFINGTLKNPADYNLTYNASCAYIYFQCTEGKHMVKIIGYRLGNMYGDINGDEFIDYRDISVPSRNFGKTYP